MPTIDRPTGHPAVRGSASGTAGEEGRVYHHVLLQRRCAAIRRPDRHQNHPHRRHRAGALMIAHGVGVTPVAVYELKRVDSNFFAEE